MQLRPPGPGPASSPGATHPAGAATEPKFTAADTDKSGTPEGAETEPRTADLVKIDAKGDGKASKDEPLAAIESGLIR